MATVTEPLLLDETGQAMITQLENINDALEVKVTPATTDKLGLVKPDGVTLNVTPDGTISSSRIFVQVPVVSEQTYTYNGLTQYLIFTSISREDVTVTGDSATDAGNYTCTVSLNNPNGMWSDGTVAPKTFPWSIQKATGSITLSESSLSLDTNTPSAVVNVTIVGDGTATFAAEDPMIASASPSVITYSSPVTITGLRTGSTTITATLAATTNYTGDSATIEVTAEMVPLKTFAAATDSEIRQMVEAADAGLIDLYEDCGWRVGQEHQTTVAAMAASGTYDGVSWSVGETHAEQTITLVLMHQGLYQLVNAVKDKQGNNRTTCSFVVGMKDCLNEGGYMNSTNTNSGSWNGCARRSWCNSAFRQALPADLRAVFKQFETVTATEYNASTTTTSQDYFALAAAAEVFKGDPDYGQGGSAGQQTAYSNLTEFNALTRFTWYETSANRRKAQGQNGSNIFWYERSPCADVTATWLCVNQGGGPRGSGANNQFGLTFFGCL